MFLVHNKIFIYTCGVVALLCNSVVTRQSSMTKNKQSNVMKIQNICNVTSTRPDKVQFAYDKVQFAYIKFIKTTKMAALQLYVTK